MFGPDLCFVGRHGETGGSSTSCMYDPLGVVRQSLGLAIGEDIHLKENGEVEGTANRKG